MNWMTPLLTFSFDICSVNKSFFNLNRRINQIEYHEINVRLFLIIQLDNIIQISIFLILEN